MQYSLDPRLISAAHGRICIFGIIYRDQTGWPAVAWHINHNLHWIESEYKSDRILPYREKLFYVCPWDIFAKYFVSVLAQWFDPGVWALSLKNDQARIQKKPEPGDGNTNCTIYRTQSGRAYVFLIKYIKAKRGGVLMVRPLVPPLSHRTTPW